VSFSFAEQKDATVELLDVSSRTISALNLENVLTFKQELGSSDLANGVYFVRISTEEGVVTRKIIVHR
jgi:hypothetical protein